MLSVADVEAQVLDLLVHETLGQFEILHELGRGGMAMVYLAHDISLNRKVAIKVMSPALGVDPDMAERFIREAQTSASLSHPNIIQVYAVKQTPDISYFVMKFISGRPLDSLMEEVGPMNCTMAQTILTQVAAGLGYGHKKGIVHRDVKPGNVMIDEDGWAIVTDFGIAKVEEASSLTQTGAAIGTPSYMSPEQLVAGDVTGASDQYSLGVMAYEMMTGRKPFEGDSVMSIMYGHVHEPPPPFQEEFPDVTPELHATIMRMLEKMPENRFESMDALVAALGAGQLSPDDPVRQEMITLATQGMSAKLLETLRTPRSPIPVNSGQRSRKQTDARPSDVTIPTGEVLQQRDTRRKRMVLGGVATVVVVGAVAASVIISGSSADETAPQAVTPATTVDQGAAAGTVDPGVDAGEQSPTISFAATQYSIETGQTVVVALSGTTADGAPVSSGDVVWSSTDSSVATVSQAGMVTGLSAGTVVIAAEFVGTVTTTNVTIDDPAPTPPLRPGRAAVASVRLSPSSGDLVVGGTVRISASALDAGGNGLSNRIPQWRSNNPSVAEVSDGLVTAKAPGSATITATIEGRTADATINVSALPVARVLVALGSTTLDVGESTQATADLLGSDGRSLADRAVRWSTSDAGVATVTADGLIVGVSGGTAAISASSEGQSGSTTVTVNAPVVVLDHRQLIEDAIQRYATALETEDISQVRLVYPRISSTEEDNWRTGWDSWSDFEVTLNADAIQVNGENANATVSGTYSFRQDGRDQELDVNIQLALELRGDAWVITSTR